MQRRRRRRWRWEGLGLVAQLSSSLSTTPGCTFCCYLSREQHEEELIDRHQRPPPLSSLSVCPVRSLLLPLLLLKWLHHFRSSTGLLPPIGQTYLPTYLPNHSVRQHTRARSCCCYCCSAWLLAWRVRIVRGRERACWRSSAGASSSGRSRPGRWAVGRWPPAAAPRPR